MVTSFAISAGTRDATGVWTPDQARRLIDATRSIGGRIAAAEFMNEPDLAAIGGAPAGYDAGRLCAGISARSGRSWSEAAPDMMILGPGTVERGRQSLPTCWPPARHGVDVVSYHYYGALSERCHGTQRRKRRCRKSGCPRTDQTAAFYRALRDRFAPGKPIWLTETADAACGGNPWAASFLDTFRYLDQLGRLAKAGVRGGDAQHAGGQRLRPARRDYASRRGRTTGPRCCGAG